jgi:hypothetical protein
MKAEVKATGVSPKDSLRSLASHYLVMGTFAISRNVAAARISDYFRN